MSISTLGRSKNHTIPHLYPHFAMRIVYVIIRDGRPVPRGRGGSPPCPALWGGGGAPCFRIGGAEDNFIIYIEYCFFFVPMMKSR